MEERIKQKFAHNLKQCEVIFNRFNEQLFHNEIHGVVKFSSLLTSESPIKVDQTTVYSQQLCYSIEIPEDIFTKLSPNHTVAKWILSQMILIYGYMHDYQLCSNRGIYKNKKFRDLAKSYGIITGSTLYGHEPVDITDKAAALVADIRFEQIPLFTLTVSHNGGKSSSTVKYTYGKESVRATKNHILYCLTNQPDSVVKKVDAFMNSLGISRMEVI